MADWNTSRSQGKSAFQRIMDDPKKVIVAVAVMACVLISVWAISFLEKGDGPDAPAVTFSLPDPTEALSPPKSGFALAKAAAPADKVEAAEADALKSLQVAQVAALAGERADRESLGEQDAHEGGAEEAGPAGDER